MGNKTEGLVKPTELEEALAEAEEWKAKALAEEAKADASTATLAVVEGREKDRVIAKHQASGRIVPANLEAVQKLAAHCTAEELDKHLATFPQLTHTEASGNPGDDRDTEARDDVEISKRLKIPMGTIKRYGNVRLVRFDGTAEMQDGTIVSMADLKEGRV